MSPNSSDVPPHIKHQTTYFRTPDECGTENTEKKREKIILVFYSYPSFILVFVAVVVFNPPTRHGKALPVIKMKIKRNNKKERDRLQLLASVTSSAMVQSCDYNTCSLYLTASRFLSSRDLIEEYPEAVEASFASYNIVEQEAMRKNDEREDKMKKNRENVNTQNVLPNLAYDGRQPTTTCASKK